MDKSDYFSIAGVIIFVSLISGAMIGLAYDEWLRRKPIWDANAQLELQMIKKKKFNLWTNRCLKDTN